jgi:hypothetical protein
MEELLDVEKVMQDDLRYLSVWVISLLKTSLEALEFSTLDPNQS